MTEVENCLWRSPVFAAKKFLDYATGYASQPCKNLYIGEYGWANDISGMSTSILLGDAHNLFACSRVVGARLNDNEASVEFTELLRHIRVHKAEMLDNFELVCSSQNRFDIQHVLKSIFTSKLSFYVYKSRASVNVGIYFIEKCCSIADALKSVKCDVDALAVEADLYGE